MFRLCTEHKLDTVYISPESVRDYYIRQNATCHSYSPFHQSLGILRRSGEAQVRSKQKSTTRIYYVPAPDVPAAYLQYTLISKPNFPDFGMVLASFFYGYLREPL